MAKICLAVGPFEQHNALLPCRCYLLILQTGGELTVIYCR